MAGSQDDADPGRYGPLAGLIRTVKRQFAIDKSREAATLIEDVTDKIAKAADAYDLSHRDAFTAETHRAFQKRVRDIIEGSWTYRDGDHRSTAALDWLVYLLGPRKLEFFDETHDDLADAITDARERREAAAGSAGGTAMAKATLEAAQDQSKYLKKMMNANWDKPSAAYEQACEIFDAVVAEPDKLLERMSKAAMEGKVDPAFYSFAQLAHKTLDADHLILKAIQYSVDTNDFKFSIAFVNHVMIQTDADRRQYYKQIELGATEAQPFISSVSQGERRILKTALDQAINDAHGGLQQGAAMLAGGGGGPRRPKASPFARASLARALDVANDEAVRRVTKLDTDIADKIRELQTWANRDFDIVGGSEAKVRTLLDPPKPEEEVQYWVPLHGPDGEIHLKADFRDLAKVIIEMRRRGELSGEALRSIKKNVSHLEGIVSGRLTATRQGGRPNARGGAEVQGGAADLAPQIKGRDQRITTLQQDLSASKADRERLLKKIRETEPGFQ